MKKGHSFMISSLTKKHFLLLFLLLAFLLLAGKPASALELAWPVSPSGTHLDDNSNLNTFVRYIYEWSIAIGAIAAFISAVIAGFGYITSTGDPNKMKEARDRISSAAAGLILLLSSFLILNTINPELTSLRVPEFIPPDKVFDEFAWPEENLNVPCSQASLFSEKNFGGSSTVIVPGGTSDLSFQSATSSGNCRLNFYKNDDCSGDPPFYALLSANQQLNDVVHFLNSNDIYDTSIIGCVLLRDI